MNSLERFHATACYQPRDRIMYWGFPIRESTRNRWYTEGLTPNTDPHELFGFDRWDGIPVRADMWPPFEEETVEQRGEYKIWRDAQGAIRKDFKRIATPGFVTRSWLRFPVEERADFLAMRSRFDPDDGARFPADWQHAKTRIPERDSPISWQVPGLFWTMRGWMGFENTCIAFYDKPGLVSEMVEFVTDFICRLLKNALDDQDVELDLMVISEDMSYKHAPMIGPEMCRDFLLEGYRRINDTARQFGTRYIVVDSDGYCNPLIPVWLEAGIDGIYPMEVASGVDVVELRRQYGRRLLMFGNIDKRELAKGSDAIDREVNRKIPLALEGGFIIGVDHAVPPDVSFENYVHYVKTLRRCGGLRRAETDLPRPS